MRPHRFSSIEPLEDRIAPAGLISTIHANSIKYTDSQGDLVTVSFSKNFITSTNAASIFTLVPAGSGAELESINLTGIASAASKLAGMNITVTAKTPSGGAGDGLVNVGFIDATGINLGTVKVGGDLGGIDAGVGKLTQNAVHALKVDSFGTGLAMQAGGPNLVSNLEGNLSNLTVNGILPSSDMTGNVNGETLNVAGSISTALIKGSMGGSITAGVSVKSATINGNLIGGATVLTGKEIGKLNVKGSITGTSAAPVIISAQGPGAVGTADVAIGSLTVNGNVSYAVVLAGYTTALQPEDPTAQIGPVKVVGNFTASDLVAGVQGTMNGSSFVFGTVADEAITGGEAVVTDAIVSKIASVTIGGTVAGDSVSGAFYGIAAEYVESVKVGSTIELLQAGPSNDLFSTSKDIPLASNVTVDEVLTPPALFNSIHGNSVQYTDSQGDLVTVAFSKSFITAQNAASIFTLARVGSGEELESINLAGIPSAPSVLGGMDITITAQTPAGGSGDGLANVGFIEATGINLGTVKVAGDLGGINAGAGKVTQSAVHTLTLDSFGAGVAMQAGGSNLAGTLEGSLSSLTVTGVLPTTDHTGVTDGESLNVEGGVTTVLITGNMDASTQSGVAGAASIVAGGNIGSVTVTGNVVANSAQDSGEIKSFEGNVASVTIGGNLDGSQGTAEYSGDIVAAGSLSSITIGGNVLGGAAAYTGAIQGLTGVGTVKITGSLEGGSVPYSGAVVSGNTLTSLTVDENVTAGASILASHQIGAITVKGDINGAAGAPVIVAAQGLVTTRTDVAIGSLEVDGNMSNAVVLAGYNTSLQPEDPNAQIGPVSVGGNFTASDLVAGVQGTMNGSSFVFGTASDQAISGGLVGGMPNIVSKIASVTIGGTVTGDSVVGDAYGISAENVVSVKVGSTVEPLQTGPNNDLFSTSSEISLASNVTIDEVTAPLV